MKEVADNRRNARCAGQTRSWAVVGRGSKSGSETGQVVAIEALLGRWSVRVVRVCAHLDQRQVLALDENRPLRRACRGERLPWLKLRSPDARQQVRLP